MSRLAYATSADVDSRLIGRDLEEAEANVVATRLEDAELKIRARIPDLDAKVLEGKISEAVVVMIEAEMILRLIRNPEGFTQESDGNYSYMMSQQVASGKLDVLPEEWALLGIKGGVYTISVLPKMPWEV